MPHSLSNSQGIRFLCVDTETGGVDSQFDALLQIGAVAVLRKPNGEFQILDEIEINVSPPSKLAVNEHALQKNRIDLPAHLDIAVQEHNAVLEFNNFAVHYRNGKHFPFLVGWNVNFDIQFLQQLYNRCGFSWPFYFINYDVAERWKFHNLFVQGNAAFPGIEEAAKKILGPETVVEHSALEDAKMTVAILSKFVAHELANI